MSSSARQLGSQTHEQFACVGTQCIYSMLLKMILPFRWTTGILKRDTFVLHGFGFFCFFFFFFFFQNFITKEETVPVLTIHLHEQSLNLFSTWSYPGHQVVFNCPASIPSYYNNSLVFLGTTSSICIHVV